MCAPKRAAANISEFDTLLLSPTYASFRPSSRPLCSRIVRKSAIAWQGWLKSVRPLITGTLAYSAIRSTMSWAKVRIMMPCTMRSRFLATS